MLLGKPRLFGLLLWVIPAGVMISQGAVAQAFLGSFVVLAALLLLKVVSSYWLLKRLRAQPVFPAGAPEIDAILKRIALRLGLKPPRLYLLPTAYPNALLIPLLRGPALVVTRGLSDALNSEEFEGVAASLLVRHRMKVDFFQLLYAGAGLITAGLLQFLRGLFYLGAPKHPHFSSDNVLVLGLSVLSHSLNATLATALLSKRWIAEADREAALVVENPLFLAAALRRLARARESFPHYDPPFCSAPLWVVSPVRNQGWGRFYQCHPPIDERIFELEKSAFQKGSLKDPFLVADIDSYLQSQ